LSKPRAIRDGFLTVPEAARLLGCSVQNVRITHLPKLSGDDVITGRPVRVRFAALVESIVARRVAEAIRQQPQPADPLLVEGDSPGLERYRMAKAKHAELDLELRRGTLIEVGAARDILARWASILRRAGERISKMNPESARIQIAALDECRIVIQEFGE